MPSHVNPYCTVEGLLKLFEIVFVKPECLYILSTVLSPLKILFPSHDNPCGLVDGELNESEIVVVKPECLYILSELVSEE